MRAIETAEYFIIFPLKFFVFDPTVCVIVNLRRGYGRISICYVRSLVEHGERRIVEINWLFESVDRSLKSAQANLTEGKKSRGYVSAARKNHRLFTSLLGRHT